MNAAAVLLAPWHAVPRWNRWYAGVVFAGALLAAVLLGVFMRSADWALLAGAVVGLGEFFLGMFLLAPGLLLAVDARQLRVPGLQRSAVLGSAALAVAMIALPAAALGLAGGHAADIACVLALALCGGFLIGLMPALVCAFLGLLPMALHTLGSQLELPEPGHPGFLRFGAGLAVALLALGAWRWRRQLRLADPYRQGWSQPMVAQFRRANRTGGWAGLSGGLPDSVQQIRQQPEWLRPAVDLAPSGPRRPRYSLRVALGGPFMPMTLGSRVRHLATSLLPGMLVMGMLWLQAAHRQHGFHPAMLAEWAGMFAWFGSFVSLLVTVLAAMQLGQRWRKSNAELPLLALLPGLGTPLQLRRHLLGASLLPGLGLQLAVLAGLVALASCMHLGWVAAMVVALTQTTSIAVLVAFTLAITGGCPLPGWGTTIVCIASFVLMSVSLPLLLDRDMASAAAHGMWLAVLAAGWAALLLALAWLGRRGWRGLVRRPHPFLANLD